MTVYRITYRDIEMREAIIEADNEHDARELVHRGDVFDSSLIETEATELVSIEVDE